MNKCTKIESSLQYVFSLEKFLNDIFRELSFSRKLYCRIYLAVLESFNNAVIHGNNKDSSKYVSISFIESVDQYIFIIDDEGVGFNYTNVPDPCLVGNIRKESGRGIFIMKQYADKVSFMNNGSSVKLIFNK